MPECGLTRIKCNMKILQGIDLLKINRIKKIYNQYEYKFLEKFFSKKEIKQINQNKISQIKKIAGKFSCKEAAAKALGTGISKGVTFKDFEILNENSGQPQLQLFGVAKKNLKNLASTSVSISHDEEYVISVVTFLLKK